MDKMFLKNDWDMPNIHEDKRSFEEYYLPLFQHEEDRCTRQIPTLYAPDFDKWSWIP